MTTILWMSLMLSPAAGPSSRTDTGLLVLNIRNLETARGEVHIALYNSEADFMNIEKRVAGLSVPVKSKDPLKAELGRFPFGTYAVAIFHDLNGNGELDKNSFGIPTEPYAFSNNPRAKWRAPTFRETRFELRQPKLALDIELKRWKAY